MRETYLQCALKLAQSLLNADHCDEAMRICHEILAADPCSELAFQVLMQCHAARGNRAAVHSVYQRCLNILRDDLDVEPSPEITALFKQLSQ
jgi:DNA-binding SARP family transcriptional activator